jgi:hypothetical protein
VHLAEAPAGAREVLGRREDRPSVYIAEAGDNSVGIDLFPVQAEQLRAVFHKKLNFLKCAFIEKKVQSFPGGEFAQFVLLLDQFLSAKRHKLGFSLFEILYSIICKSHISSPLRLNLEFDGIEYDYHLSFSIAIGI